MVKREDITRKSVELAIETFLGLAYGERKKPRSELPRAPDDGSSAFDLLHCETKEALSESERAPERYALRLGNRNYPYMKLVLQEHLVPGEFYFLVDTHDQMEIKPDFPDYEAWVKVKEFNLLLKREIEEAFISAGLPTIDAVRQRVEELEEGSAAAEPRGALVLIVDDNEAEARALEHLLRVQGYEVARAANGREALDRLRYLEPAILVLDYEMPEMDGISLIRELRSDETTRSIPVLLTTAAEVLAKDRDSADGFLAKPYVSNELLSLVQNLLERK